MIAVALLEPVQSMVDTGNSDGTISVLKEMGSISGFDLIKDYGLNTNAFMCPHLLIDLMQVIIGEYSPKIAVRGEHNVKRQQQSHNHLSRSCFIRRRPFLLPVGAWPERRKSHAQIFYERY